MVSSTDLINMLNVVTKQIVITNAGSKDVNGIYKDIGLHNDVPFYENANKVLISREKIGGQTGWY